MSGHKGGYRAKQALGQHFIKDQALLDELVALSDVGPEDSVFEIGPGLGTLTLALARRAKQVVAMEVDPDLIPILQVVLHGLPQVELVLGDVMTADLISILSPLGPFKVVANLPYYLTTPILKLLLGLPLPVTAIHVMVQWEAAQRIVAKPGTAPYGPLAVLAQYKAVPQIVRHIEAAVFSPPPKTDSAFVSLPIRQQPAVQVGDEALFFRLVDAAFAMRRKTLVNNLIPALAITREEALQLVEGLGLGPTVRGEALSLAQFGLLTQAVAARQAGTSVDSAGSMA